MENPLNTVLRKPFYGVLPAGGTLAFTVSPPMNAQETLLCAASAPREVSFNVPRPDAIVVTSRAQIPVAFGVLVIPTNVIGPNESMIASLLLRARAFFARLRG